MATTPADFDALSGIEVEHTTIDHQQIIDAVASLGLDANDVLCLHMDGNHVGVVMFGPRGEDGRLQMNPDEERESKGLVTKRRLVLTSDLGCGQVCDTCGVLG